MINIEEIYAENPKNNPFEDDIFYKTFSPIIVKIPKIDMEFIFRENQFQLIIQKNNELIANGCNELSVKLRYKKPTRDIHSLDIPIIVNINFSDFQYDLNQTSKEKILNLLNLESTQLLYVYENLNIEATSDRALLIYQTINALQYGMDIDVFLDYHYIKTTKGYKLAGEFTSYSTNGRIINHIISNKKLLESMNNKNYEKFFQFIEGSLNEYSYNQGILISLPSSKEFTPEWIEEYKKQTSLLDLAGRCSPIFTEEEIIKLKVGIILNFQERKNNLKIDPTIIYHLAHLEKDEIQKILSKIDNHDLKEKMFNEIKHFAKTEKTCIKEFKNKQATQIVIDWQKICIYKFPQIYQKIDIPENFVDSLKLRRDEVSNIYTSPNAFPILKQIFKYLEIAELILDNHLNDYFNNQKIALTHAYTQEIAQSHNIYLTNKGLIFTTYSDEKFSKTIINEILSQIIENISMESLSSVDYAVASIQKILLHSHILNFDECDSITDTNEGNSYKI